MTREGGTCPNSGLIMLGYTAEVKQKACKARQKSSQTNESKVDY